MNIIDIFPWDEQFNTGLKEVDNQHRKLVEILNHLASSIAYNATEDALNNIFDELTSYTIYHFETEESIWKHYLPNDPLDSKHQDIHKSFVNTVLKLKSKQNSKPLCELAEEALGFLTRWLASHILETDRHMAYIVLALKDGFNLDEAKLRADKQMNGSTRLLIDIILSIYSTLSSNTLYLMRELKSYQNLEQKVDNQERYKDLLLELSTDLINLPTEDINSNIQKTLEKTSTFLGTDRAYIFDYDFNAKTTTNTYEWCIEGITPHIEELKDVSMEFIPGWPETHLKGEYVLIQDLSLVKGPIHKILSPQGIKSLITFPLFKNSKCMGFVGFDAVNEKHYFSLNEIKLLELFSKLLSNIVSRRDNECKLSHERIELQKSEERFSLAMKGANDGLWDWKLGTDEVYYSPRWKSMLGYEDNEIKNSFKVWEKLIHPDDKEIILNQIQDYLDEKSNRFEAEIRMQHKDGHYIFILTRAFLSKNRDNQAIRLVGTHVDITESKKIKAFDDQNARILKMIATGVIASKVYDEIALMYEAKYPGMRCSLLELKDGVLLHGGAPSMPKEYCDAIHGLKNGPEVGSCGRSTYLGVRTLVEDIKTDSKWTNIKDAALPHGMRSCWLEPIKDSLGKVLGAFGMYYNYPALPNEKELEDLISAANLASIVMERDQTSKRIFKAEKKLKKHDKYLQSIIDGINDPILVIKEDYTVELMNKSVKNSLHNLKFANPKYPKCYEISHNRATPCDESEHLCPLRDVIKSRQHTTVVHNHKTKDGEDCFVELSASPLFDENKNCIGIIEASRDITRHLSTQDELKKQKNILDYQAHHDALTNLPNRVLFNDRLTQAIEEAKRNKTNVALLFIDLDHFKEINDSLGHEIGDEVLKVVSTRLKEVVREKDTVARLGGDEFTVIIEELFEAQNVSIIASKIIETLSTPIINNNNTLYISCSIGISIYPEDGVSPSDLLKYADSAMYKAKNEGRSNYQYYNSTLTQLAFERVVMETSLRTALENEEFVIFYQPQVNAITNKIVGMEALVRWEHPTMGLVSPTKFIPLAESTGLIVELDRLVMKIAMTQFTLWYKSGLKPGKLAMNLAIKQLKKYDFIDTLQDLIKETKCKPEWIELEVAEGQIMTNPEEAIKTLQQISDMGIEISVDDFGTGYSSLAYLKRLPIDKLKIDQTFIRDLPGDEEDEAITKAVIALAHSLSLKVIAEGVETKKQRDFIVGNKCENIQGYFYYKPIPSDDIEKILIFELNLQNKENMN
ncbi:MAG: hypothetical protein CL623_00910 [Arcobacter sp.]|nr:hypothetical protein [Arcobacter sp.]